MKKSLLVAAAALMAFAFVSCGGEKEAVIKIGVYEPASGDNGVGGKQKTLGMQYANSVTPTVDISGKTYKVQLEIVDDESSNDKAVTAASELISKGVSVVLGSYGSGGAIAASDTFAAANVPGIGMSYLIQNLALYITGGLLKSYPKIPWISDSVTVLGAITKRVTLITRLKERSWQFAGTLSGGEQKMLAVGRALMSKPKVLMLDEPSLGLAPLVVQQIFDIVKEINKNGVTVSLIEQNANMALKTAHIAYVIETGEIVLSESGAEVMANSQVREAYLGKKK